MKIEDYKRLESAAREVCLARGQNPDEQVGTERASWEDGPTYDVYYCSTRWRNVAQELWDFEVKGRALFNLRAYSAEGPNDK